MEANWLDASEIDNRLDPYRYSPVFMRAVQTLKSSQCPVADLNSARDPKEPLNYGILQPREFLREGGIPMVRAVDLGHPFINTADVVRVPPDVELPYRRSRLRSGDVLISIAGTLGAIAICPSGWPVANVNQSVARLRVNERHDPYYVAAFLMTTNGQTLLMREAVGSVQRHLNLEDIPSVLFPAPNINVERWIGNKLRKAECLMAAADRQRTTAAALLGDGLLLDELHVSEGNFAWCNGEAFGPVRLDADYYQPKYLSMTQHFALLERRGITSIELSELIHDGAYGVLPPSDTYGTGNLPFVRAEALSQFILDTSNPILVPVEYSNPKALGRRGELLLEVKGQIRGGALCPPEADGWLLNGSIYRMGLRPDVPAGYVLAVLLSPIGELQKQRAAANSIISYLSVDFLNLLIPRLKPELEERIDQAIRTYSDHIAEVRRLVRSATLAAEALIKGTLDESQLRIEGEAIDVWLNQPAQSGTESSIKCL